MARSWWLCLLVGLAASGCGAVPASKPENTVLPEPQVHLTRASATPVVESPVAKTARTAIPTRAPAIQGSLAEMARAVYGDRLVTEIQIPSIRVDAPVVPVGWEAAGENGESLEWESPEASVGWASSSALPGQGGNVILYGHNNLHSNVFLHLDQVESGDEIELRTGEGIYHYQVETVEIIPVTDEKADAAAARKYFQTGGEARLTILSCWPPTSNTHRVIVIARPGP